MLIDRAHTAQAGFGGGNLRLFGQIAFIDQHHIGSAPHWPGRAGRGRPLLSSTASSPSTRGSSRHTVARRSSLSLKVGPVSASMMPSGWPMPVGSMISRSGRASSIRSFTVARRDGPNAQKIRPPANSLICSPSPSGIIS